MTAAEAIPESRGPNPFMQRLFLPIDNGPLALFRICFGFLLCYHCLSFMADGSLHAVFIQPPFTFNFIGFDFLQPLPGNGMYYYFGIMAALGLLVMLGAAYRFAMPGFALMWTIIYLMQKSNYNNHYYLMVLLCWIMVFLPANRRLSVDARRKASLRSGTCPQWVNWLMIAQMAIVYFYAGISKISPDWLNGKFIAIRFSRLALHPTLGSIYGNSTFQTFICYSGILFDLLLVPLLLWKKSRKAAIVTAICFHLFNSYTFRIGIFPYLSIGWLIFFMDPAFIKKLIKSHKTIHSNQLEQNSRTLKRAFTASALALYIFVQLILPMRSWFFPGNVFWTEEGYRMSWKMMLRTKKGTLHFLVTDKASGREWNIDPSKAFAPVHMVWLSGSPDIIWQYAQRIKKDFSKTGYPDVSVHAIGEVSINRNPPRPLVDSSADLAAEKWEPFCHSDWILPDK
jgi:hypothetical protein